MENTQTLDPETNNHRFKGDTGKDNGDGVICPLCKKEVPLIDFGNGWVGVCCGKLVYSSLTRKQKQP